MTNDICHDSCKNYHEKPVMDQHNSCSEDLLYSYLSWDIRRLTTKRDEMSARKL